MDVFVLFSSIEIYALGGFLLLNLVVLCPSWPYVFKFYYVATLSFQIVVTSGFVGLSATISVLDNRLLDSITIKENCAFSVLGLDELGILVKLYPKKSIKPCLLK